MFSEAIIRGSATLTPARKTNVAAGQADLIDLADAGADARVIVGDYLRVSAPFPCKCAARAGARKYGPAALILTVLEVAVHLFMEHVCVQNWTLAMLCEWLQKQEIEHKIAHLEFIEALTTVWILEE